MTQTFSKRLVNKLIDWLIAFCGASILLWFIIAQPVFINKSIDIPHNVDLQKLKDHVQLLTVGYAPRTVNYNNLNDTAAYIYGQFSTFGMPEYQNINTIANEYRNVSLQLGPDTNELYIIGAHYDAADDSIDNEGNASGITTLIELARYLSTQRHNLEIGVIFIAYPLSLNQADNYVNTGSYYHANLLKKQNKDVRLMISLDSVGQISSSEYTKSHSFKSLGFLYPQKKNYVNMIGRLKDFKGIRELKKDFNSASRLSLNSQNLFENFNKTHSGDHKNYWQQGYPAVLISDNTNNSLKKSHSTIEPKDRLDYDKLAMIIKGLSHVIINSDLNNQAKTRLVQRSRNNIGNSLLF